MRSAVFTRVLLLAGLCALCECGNSSPAQPPVITCTQGLESPTVLQRAPSDSLPCDLLPPR
jgi:hypothetical protein